MLVQAAGSGQPEPFVPWAGHSEVMQLGFSHCCVCLQAMPFHSKVSREQLQRYSKVKLKFTPQTPG